MKFRTKFVLLFIISSLIQVGIIGFSSYYFAKELALNNKKKDILDIINLIDVNINTQARFIDNVLDEWSTDINVTTDIYQQNTTENIETLANYLTHSIQNAKNIKIIDFTSLETYTQLSKNIIKKARNNPHTLYWNDDHFMTANDSEELLALYGLSDDLAILLNIENTMLASVIPDVQNLLINQYIAIVDAKENILVSNKLIPTDDFNTIINQSMDKRLGDIIINDTEYYYSERYNGLTGWKIISFMPTNKIFYGSNRLRDIIFFTIIICTALFSLLSIIILYQLINPLEDVASSMKHAEENHYREKLKTTKKDEVGVIINAYNHLITKINKLIQDVYLREISQKNAEIEALESQINPHFLYNTLDSINWMALESEQYEISHVIIALGNLLKYSTSSQNSMVTLTQEVENIESYLLIQKNRFEDRLNWQIRVPQELGCFLVPKLILQPIVENAIIHGIEGTNQVSVLSILIVAKYTEFGILISITDNGNGMDEKKMEQLNYLLSNQSEELNSIGLKNVNKRLKLYFDSSSGVFIDKNEEGNTCVVLNIIKEE